MACRLNYSFGQNLRTGGSVKAKIGKAFWLASAPLQVARAILSRS